MGACRYGISLRVFNLISEHEKRNSISTSNHVLLCLLYFNLLITTFMMIYRRFSGTFHRFRSFSESCPKANKRFQTFSETVSEDCRRCSKITEDF